MGSLRDMRQVQGRAHVYPFCSYFSYYFSVVSYVARCTGAKVVSHNIHPAFCTFSSFCYVKPLCVEPYGLEQSRLLSASFLLQLA